jgi:hypothetical protein
MNCVETDTLLSVVEALGDQSERKLAHVAQCATCRAAVGDLATLRAALAPEEMGPLAIERTANAIGPLADQRRREKIGLIGLTVVYGLVVAVTVIIGVAFVGSMGDAGLFFIRGNLEYVNEAIKAAAPLGALAAWRAYRYERARQRQAGIF